MLGLKLIHSTKKGPWCETGKHWTVSPAWNCHRCIVSLQNRYEPWKLIAGGYFVFSHGIFKHNNDDVIKWKHFPRYWPFVRGIYQSPVNSPHKGQWHGWVNNREAGDLRRHCGHYDVTVWHIWLSSSLVYAREQRSTYDIVTNDNDIIQLIMGYRFIIEIRRQSSMHQVSALYHM